MKWKTILDNARRELHKKREKLPLEKLTNDNINEYSRYYQTIGSAQLAIIFEPIISEPKHFKGVFDLALRGGYNHAAVWEDIIVHYQKKNGNKKFEKHHSTSSMADFNDGSDAKTAIICPSSGGSRPRLNVSFMFSSTKPGLLRYIVVNPFTDQIYNFAFTKKFSKILNEKYSPGRRGDVSFDVKWTLDHDFIDGPLITKPTKGKKAKVCRTKTLRYRVPTMKDVATK